mmetsp:Transcript_56083/g.88892  ORF Transcript_56083/g.88892 Transcript_56083/m.88892 type:complete len:233 (-) Transcript_56083:33-731(-)
MVGLSSMASLAVHWSRDNNPRKISLLRGVNRLQASSIATTTPDVAVVASGLGVFLLPIIASMDNFVLGVALGVGGQSLPPSVVLIVAIMNAVGMMLSGMVGKIAGSWAPVAASILAGGFFIVVGGFEIRSWMLEEESPTDMLFNLAATRNAWILGLPMTLNNLASGLAGGLVGMNIWLLGLLTFLASSVLMCLGYALGSCTGKALPTDPRLPVGVVFLCLGLVQIAPLMSES